MVNQTMQIDQFIKDYTEELVSGNAAYFVGAGISRNSHLPNWIELLRPYADKIGIESLENRDLPLIAQYIINEEQGNRGPFINSISRKLRKSFSPNIYHEFISKTNVKTIWTTNYDNLLEKAFSNHILDLKFNEDSISRDLPDSQVQIIKMHGCIFNSHRDEIVITQADYDDFFINKPAISQRLKLDLLQKSFLFIGYGYNDPNIKNIVSEARRLTGQNTRQHYLITKNEPNNTEFKHWCGNLKRYGIRVVTIEDFEELATILKRLSLMSRGKSLFISGSHRTEENENVKAITQYLASQDDIILNDGQSTGPMRVATKVFLETVISRKSDINKRLRFFPNPYAANERFANDPSLLTILKQWRLPLLKATYIMLSFDGGMGTRAEIEVALDMGCIVIPFFEDEKQETWEFIENPLVQERIGEFDPRYLDKVSDRTASYSDVINLINKILN